MGFWARWFGYAKAKVNDTLRSADEELDRREAELEADRADQPWLRDDAAAPSLDDVEKRIDAMKPPAERAAPKTDEELAFELAEQRRQADERLAQIRESLDLDTDDPKR